MDFFSLLTSSEFKTFKTLRVKSQYMNEFYLFILNSEKRLLKNQLQTLNKNHISLIFKINIFILIN